MNIRNLLVITVLASIVATVSYADSDVTIPSKKEKESYKYLKKHMGKDSLLVRECENKHPIERFFENTPFEDLAKTNKTQHCEFLDLILSIDDKLDPSSDQRFRINKKINYVLREEDRPARIAEMRKYHSKLRKQ